MAAGFGGGRIRALAAALLNPAAALLKPLQQVDNCWQSIGGSSRGYPTRAKLRERQSRRKDSDDEALWYDPVDRHVPWPRRRNDNKHEDPRAKKKKSNNHRSFKLRSEKYLKPFTLDIYISNKYVHASIMHRALHKVVAVANSNAKEFRGTLPAYGDMRACWVIGKVLANRAKEADVYTVRYEPRRGEKPDSKIMAIVDTLLENGIALELDHNYG